jgi:hypothetical protein
MSDLVKQGNGAIATMNDIDPFTAYGMRAGGAAGGQYLSFKNGEFLYGQNSTMLPLGTRLVANMQGLRVGWRRWQDSQVTDDLTVPLIERRPLEPRNSLGDNDPQMWSKGPDGRPRDPWQMTNILEMVDQQGQKFIFSTGSKGGVGAIARLSAEYGKLYRQKPGLAPIIALANDWYAHPEYGKTYVPEFNIVGWANPETLEPDDDVVLPGIDPPKEEPKKESSKRTTPRF